MKTRATLTVIVKVEFCGEPPTKADVKAICDHLGDEAEDFIEMASDGNAYARVSVSGVLRGEGRLR